MTETADEALITMRELMTELLSTIDTWSGQVADPGHFRHRLLRAHALAMLDEIEQLASGRLDSQPPSGRDSALRALGAGNALR
ncbi:MAG: hypothetical protein Q8S73_36430 [Deltaproteobacteria bacterium]|jgi:hypothetical protein|nr:hypothetical protein [Myxococcales bacterium]MDP3219646.1 hypothetical protein [Deltaproteobacteria bacterium]